MTRFIFPIILIIIAVAVFFVLTNPLYTEIGLLKAEATSYNKALDSSLELEQERDKLVAKEVSITEENRDRIKKFLPENVDNIRLVLEIEKIAKPFGMVLKDVKYNAQATEAEEGKTVVQGGKNISDKKDYGIFDLEFSTSGTYDNFINFTKALESNLRVVDISSITFSSINIATSGINTGLGIKTNSPEIYSYNFKIKTYWLKN